MLRARSRDHRLLTILARNFFVEDNGFPLRLKKSLANHARKNTSGG